MIRSAWKEGEEEKTREEKRRSWTLRTRFGRRMASFGAMHLIHPVWGGYIKWTQASVVTGWNGMDSYGETLVEKLYYSLVCYSSICTTNDMTKEIKEWWGAFSLCSCSIRKGRAVLSLSVPNHTLLSSPSLTHTDSFFFFFLFLFVLFASPSSSSPAPPSSAAPSSLARHVTSRSFCFLCSFVCDLLVEFWSQLGCKYSCNKRDESGTKHLRVRQVVLGHLEHFTGSVCILNTKHKKKRREKKVLVFFVLRARQCVFVFCVCVVF